MARSDDFPIWVLTKYPWGKVTGADFRFSSPRGHHEEQAGLLTALDSFDEPLQPAADVLVDPPRQILGPKTLDEGQQPAPGELPRGQLTHRISGRSSFVELGGDVREGEGCVGLCLGLWCALYRALWRLFRGRGGLWRLGDGQRGRGGLSAASLGLWQGRLRRQFDAEVTDRVLGELRGEAEGLQITLNLAAGAGSSR